MLQIIEITHEKIDSDSIINKFRDSKVDEGITKEVTKLAYEAYEPMAIKVMTDIANKARELYTDLIGTAIIHRLGVVEPTQASILVVTTSAHRKPAIQALDWLMDELKAKVPIWKKEIYMDGSVWKENSENRLPSSGN
ncbi:hypothetical protein HDV02_000041 [Globomyces sp. JEL0801]|nr:hypothetical protein HDV02_000041 [Globomyces sp. JEL0801]